MAMYPTKIDDSDETEMEMEMEMEMDMDIEMELKMEMGMEGWMKIRCARQCRQVVLDGMGDGGDGVGDRKVS